MSISTLRMAVLDHLDTYSDPIHSILVNRNYSLATDMSFDARENLQAFVIIPDNGYVIAKNEAISRSFTETVTFVIDILNQISKTFDERMAAYDLVQEVANHMSLIENNLGYSLSDIQPTLISPMSYGNFNGLVSSVQISFIRVI